MSQTTLIKFRERVRSERKKKGFLQVKLASGWGEAVVDMIARDLTRELNGAKGFSRRNLYRIK